MKMNSWILDLEFGLLFLVFRGTCGGGEGRNEIREKERDTKTQPSKI